MTIDELNALTTLTATDEVPVWDSEESGEPTKKITASNLAASVKSLASLPNTTEMNDAIAQSTAIFHSMQITVPSSRGQTATVSLPSGWTRRNCIIEQAYISKFSGSNIYFSDTLANEGVTFVFTGDSLTVITSASAQTGWFGETANVILRKVQ